MRLAATVAALQASMPETNKLSDQNRSGGANRNDCQPGGYLVGSVALPAAANLRLEQVHITRLIGTGAVKREPGDYMRDRFGASTWRVTPRKSITAAAAATNRS